MTRLLIVTAVEAERDAVLGGLGGRGTAVTWPPPGSLGRPVDRGSPDGVDVVAAGVGMVASTGCAAVLAMAASTAGRPYTALVNLGIAGGFAGRAAMGGTIVGTRAVAADLGVDAPTGFVALPALGFGTDTVEADADLVERLRRALPAAVAGPILSVQTVTGTDERAAEMLRRHPDAAAEAMEGYGVAHVAAACRLPFVEVRTVSNLVGVRDRAAWRIPEALTALTEAARVVGTLVG